MNTATAKNAKDLFNIMNESSIAVRRGTTAVHVQPCNEANAVTQNEKYEVIYKQELQFSWPRRLIRVILGILIVVGTLFLALLLQNVRRLFASGIPYHSKSLQNLNAETPASSETVPVLQTAPFLLHLTFPADHPLMSRLSLPANDAVLDTYIFQWLEDEEKVKRILHDKKSVFRTDETAGAALATAIRERLKAFEEIDLTRRLSNLLERQKFVLTVDFLIPAWPDSPLRYALMDKEEVDALTLGDMEGKDKSAVLYFCFWMHYLVKRSSSDGTTEHCSSLKNEDWRKWRLQALSQLTSEQFQRTFKELPLFAFCLINPKILSDIDLEQLRQEQIEILFLRPDIVKKLPDEVFFTLFPKVPLNCLDSISIKQWKLLNPSKITKEQFDKITLTKSASGMFTVSMNFQKPELFVTPMGKNWLNIMDPATVYVFAPYFHTSRLDSHWEYVHNDYLRHVLYKPPEAGDGAQIEAFLRNEQFRDKSFERLIVQIAAPEPTLPNTNRIELIQSLEWDDLITLVQRLPKNTETLAYWEHVNLDLVLKMIEKSVIEQFDPSIRGNWLEIALKKRSESVKNFKKVHVENLTKALGSPLPNWLPKVSKADGEE